MRYSSSPRMQQTNHVDGDGSLGSQDGPRREDGATPERVVRYQIASLCPAPMELGFDPLLSRFEPRSFVFSSQPLAQKSIMPSPWSIPPRLLIQEHFMSRLSPNQWLSLATRIVSAGNLMLLPFAH
jgi:hypothetical protein